MSSTGTEIRCHGHGSGRKESTDAWYWGKETTDTRRSPCQSAVLQCCPALRSLLSTTLVFFITSSSYLLRYLFFSVFSSHSFFLYSNFIYLTIQTFCSSLPTFATCSHSLLLDFAARPQSDPDEAYFLPSGPGSLSGLATKSDKKMLGISRLNFFI